MEPARPARIRGAKAAPWLAVAAVCVGAFMGQLDASIVTVALPAVRRDLHVSLAGVEWVSLCYLLSLVGFVAAVGRWADMVGRKLLYLYGFGVFTLASVGCGLAPSLGVLLSARLLQGVGAAMLQANSVALIRTSVAPSKLPHAIGIQGAAQALGLALGPAVGGLLITVAGWRWVFFVNVPAGIVGIVLAWLLLPRTRVRAPRFRFDWAGLATLVPASVALLLALSLLTRGHSVLAVAALLAVSGAALTCFVRVERSSRAPLVDLSLFGERRFTAGVASGMLSYLVLFGTLFVVPVYLVEARGVSAGQAGLLLAILPAALAVTAPGAARAVQRFGAGPVSSTGMAVVAVALGVAALLAGGPPSFVVILGATGFGFGLFTPANNATVAGSGSPQQAGMVSGLLNMTRGVGTALGVAVAAASYSLAGGGGAAQARGELAVNSFRVAAALLAVLAAAAAAVTVLGTRGATRAHRSR